MFFRIETRRRAARKPGFQPGKVVAQHTPNFLLHGFWATRRSSVLGVWAAPSGQESIQDMGVGRPRAAMKPLKAIFSQGFRDPVGVVRGRFWAGLGPLGPQAGPNSTPHDPDDTSDNLKLQPQLSVAATCCATVRNPITVTVTLGPIAPPRWAPLKVKVTNSEFRIQNCHGMALKLICGADLWCTRHCWASPVILEGFWGQFFRKFATDRTTHQNSELPMYR